MKIKEPKVGDKIYIPSSNFLYQEENKLEGGLTTIDKVQINDHLPKNHSSYVVIGVICRPSTLYNYKGLVMEQEKLMEEYKGRMAHLVGVRPKPIMILDYPYRF